MFYPFKVAGFSKLQSFLSFCWPETLGREKLSAEKFLKLSAESFKPIYGRENSRAKIFKTLGREFAAESLHNKTLGRELEKLSAESF